MTFHLQRRVVLDLRIAAGLEQPVHQVAVVELGQVLVLRGAHSNLPLRQLLDHRVAVHRRLLLLDPERRLADDFLHVLLELRVELELLSLDRDDELLRFLDLETDSRRSVVQR